MISDFVKGAQKNAFDWDIRQGLELHRAIDSYTDAHPATLEARTYFKAHYRLYSGPIMDVIYDHFLARDPSEFSEESLWLFSQQAYAVLDDHQHLLPLRFAQMLPYMKSDNWLYDYRLRTGIQKSLQRMVRRAVYLSDSHTAFELLQTHYDALEQCYRAFFPDLKAFARAKLEEFNL